MNKDVIDSEGQVNVNLLESDSNRIFVYTKGADNVIFERLKNKDEGSCGKLKNMK